MQGKNIWAILWYSDSIIVSVDHVVVTRRAPGQWVVTVVTVTSCRKWQGRFSWWAALTWRWTVTVQCMSWPVPTGQPSMAHTHKGCWSYHMGSCSWVTVSWSKFPILPESIIAASVSTHSDVFVLLLNNWKGEVSHCMGVWHLHHIWFHGWCVQLFMLHRTEEDDMVRLTRIETLLVSSSFHHNKPSMSESHHLAFGRRRLSRLVRSTHYKCMELQDIFGYSMVPRDIPSNCLLASSSLGQC